MSSFIAQPTSRNTIRKITNLIRKEFELEDEPCFPVVPFLEIGLPSMDPNFSYEVVPIGEMPSDYALTLPEENKIIIREDVYERAVEGVPRDRFTLAHEIGHYIMHRPSFISLARNHKKIKVPAYKDPEWQANTFAGELLAPPDIIKGMQINEVIEQCGVSFKVAEIQLNQI